MADIQKNAEMVSIIIMSPNKNWIDAIPAEYLNYRKNCVEEHHSNKLHRRCFQQWNKTAKRYLYQVGDRFYGKRYGFVRNFTIRVINAEDSHERKYKCWMILKRHDYPSKIDYATISISSDKHGLPCGFFLNDSSEGKPFAIDLTEQALVDGLTKIFS